MKVVLFGSVIQPLMVRNTVLVTLKKILGTTKFCIETLNTFPNATLSKMKTAQHLNVTVKKVTVK